MSNESALCQELTLRGINFERQQYIPVKYKGVTIQEPLHLDILVEGKVIVEVKATEHDHSVHQAQLLTYLRLADLRLGLLINFGKSHLKDGVRRVVNGLGVENNILLK